MKYTIEDLIKGKVAIRNDGTKDELIKVLSLAFPQDPFLKRHPDGKATNGYDMLAANFYYLGIDSTLYWERGSSSPNIPVQSVKDFLEPSFEWGEEVEVRFSSNAPWLRRFYVDKSPHKSKVEKFITVDSVGLSGVYSIIRKIKEPDPILIVELTLNDIATKFGIPVENIKIKK
jgi:hypothetical protein